jgi:hypothetical protein
VNEQLERLRQLQLENEASFRALIQAREEHIEVLLLENAALKKRIEVLEGWVGDSK